jgi:hypothetical protein
MPLKIRIAGAERIINPLTRWNTIKLESSNPSIEVDPNYYVATFNTMGVNTPSR